MEEIIAPVSKELLKAELTADKRLRYTNKSHNEIYVVTWQDSPNVLREIGRLREIAFRAAGGGTGMSLDLDDFDMMEEPYKQLIVWDPDVEAILGGYRYLLGAKVKLREDGQPILATSHMEYQSTRQGSKGLFTLDNLWDGLGALTVLVPDVRYYFGKMTMYPSYNRYGRDMILYFLKKHFEDKDRLIVPIHPLQLEADTEELRKLFVYEDFKEDYKILNSEVRKLGYNIPPLVNAYMGLSPTMKMFGTAINDEFGDVEETGILIAVDEIREEKRRRHIETFSGRG